MNTRSIALIVALLVVGTFAAEDRHLLNMKKKPAASSSSLCRQGIKFFLLNRVIFKSSLLNIDKNE